MSLKYAERQNTGNAEILLTKRGPSIIITDAIALFSSMHLNIFNNLYARLDENSIVNKSFYSCLRRFLHF